VPQEEQRHDEPNRWRLEVVAVREETARVAGIASLRDPNPTGRRRRQTRRVAENGPPVAETRAP